MLLLDHLEGRVVAIESHHFGVFREKTFFVFSFSRSPDQSGSRSEYPCNFFQFDSNFPCFNMAVDTHLVYSAELLNYIVVHAQAKYQGKAASELGSRSVYYNDWGYHPAQYPLYATSYAVSPTA